MLTSMRSKPSWTSMLCSSTCPTGTKCWILCRSPTLQTHHQASIYAMQKGQISAIMFSPQSNATHVISK